MNRIFQGKKPENLDKLIESGKPVISLRARLVVKRQFHPFLRDPQIEDVADEDQCAGRPPIHPQEAQERSRVRIVRNEVGIGHQDEIAQGSYRKRNGISWLATTNSRMLCPWFM